MAFPPFFSTQFCSNSPCGKRLHYNKNLSLRKPFVFSRIWHKQHKFVDVMMSYNFQCTTKLRHNIVCEFSIGSLRSWRRSTDYVWNVFVHLFTSSLSWIYICPDKFIPHDQYFVFCRFNFELIKKRNFLDFLKVDTCDLYV
jgi:hypothetical protein